MIAAGIVTIDTMTSTTAVLSNVSVIMKPLAPITPVTVAMVGINTRATMLTASDHDRANRMMSAPASTTGTEQANAHPMISQKSAAGTTAPQVAAAPHRLHAVLVAELRAQPLDVHGHRGQIAEVPPPHLLEELLAREHGVDVGHEEQQQLELAIGQADRLAPDGRRTRCGGDGQLSGRQIDGGCADRRRSPSQQGAHPEREFTRAEGLCQ